MKNVFKTFLAVMVFSTAHASVSSEEGENLITYRFKSRESFSSNLRTVCEKPDVVGLDLSVIKARNEDLDALFEALVEREVKLEGVSHPPLSLIDLRFGSVDEEGFLGFLRKLQNGFVVGSRKIYPDVRESILRIGLGLTEDFIERMQEIAPSIFAGGVEIVQ